MATFYTPDQVSTVDSSVLKPQKPQADLASIVAALQGMQKQQVSPVQNSGPRIYMPPAAPLTPPGGDFNMSSYLSSKFGASAPQIRSITPISGGTSTMVGRAGGGGDFQSMIMGLFADAQKKANSANEGRFKAARKELAGFGKSYENDVNRQYQTDVGHAEQDAISRGLGNSTIRNSLLGGATRRKNDAMLSLKDRLASQRVNLLQSKFDNGPDPLAISQLFAQANQSAAGSGNTLASIAAALGLTR